ncbi:MAG: YdbL family protein [Kiloniellaceae bacterium]
MTRRWFTLLSLLAAAAVALPLLAGTASAQTLDELRASGKIGERYDGFAQARDPSTAEMVTEINAKRREIYQQQADKQGVPLDQVGLVYASELLPKLPAGTWFLTPENEWRRK